MVPDSTTWSIPRLKGCINKCHISEYQVVSIITLKNYNYILYKTSFQKIFDKEVFISYIGLLYQPNKDVNPPLKIQQNIATRKSTADVTMPAINTFTPESITCFAISSNDTQVASKNNVILPTILTKTAKMLLSSKPWTIARIRL